MQYFHFFSSPVPQTSPLKKIALSLYVIWTYVSCKMLVITFHFSLIVHYDPCIVCKKMNHGSLAVIDFDCGIIWPHIQNMRSC